MCVPVYVHVYNDILYPCEPNKHQSFMMNTYIKVVEREGKKRRDEVEVMLTATNRVEYVFVSDVAWQTSASCPFPPITFVTIMTQSLIPWLQSNEWPFTLLISPSYITRLHLLEK